ncbi:uncharacterized protein JCM6883_006532 [Sporobolomyces salmoneus]|uniref:uncharacterized protein n=1 Tax=Sporobolomyces salmoneus TaxID=183962 RepID=UPI00317E729D
MELIVLSTRADHESTSDFPPLPSRLRPPSPLRGDLRRANAWLTYQPFDCANYDQQANLFSHGIIMEISTHDPVHATRHPTLRATWQSHAMR